MQDPSAAVSKNLLSLNYHTPSPLSFPRSPSFLPSAWYEAVSQWWHSCCITYRRQQATEIPASGGWPNMAIGQAVCWRSGQLSHPISLSGEVVLGLKYCLLGIFYSNWLLCLLWADVHHFGCLLWADVHHFVFIVHCYVCSELTSIILVVCR